MTLEEMMVKTLGLIEELTHDASMLTEDPDIAAKFYEVTNQKMYELARIKKIPKYVELSVSAGDRITFEDIERESGYQVYQLDLITGINYQSRAHGTVLKVIDGGTAEIDFFVYPERITAKTKPKAYEFELSPDVLEIMPYGIAADLLKSDISAEYGAVYSTAYEQMLSRLDPRYQQNTIYIEYGMVI